MNKAIKHFIPIIISLVTLVFSCNQEVKVSGADNCIKYFNIAKSNINLYYRDSSTNHLDTALFYINTNTSLCPEYKTSFINLKLSILLLLKDDRQGQEFVRSLDSMDFDKDYQRGMYLGSFDAIKYEKLGDTTKRNLIYSELSTIIENYLRVNYTDREAYVDLFVTKAKYRNKAEVIDEIDSLYKDRIGDNDFVEALKQTIESLPY
jgi:hypothetical protein